MKIYSSLYIKNLRAFAPSRLFLPSHTRLFVFLLMVIPFTSSAQNNNIPYVQFDQDAIIWYIPGQSAYAPILPVIKPGFVHILQTPGFLSVSPKELSEQITGNLTIWNNSLTSTDRKEQFLASLSCLILLNYAKPSALDSAFIHTARNLQNDPDPAISREATLTVRLFEIYEGREKGT